MNEYPKIHTVYMRDPSTKHKTLIESQFSLPEFEYLKDNKWIFTEKVDGTNIRVIWKNNKIQFGGKTDFAQTPEFLLKRLDDIFSEKTSIFEREFFDTDVCLYGEGYGQKIQKGGGLYCKGQDFVLFDVKIGDIWLKRESVAEVAEMIGIRVVPEIGSGTLKDMVEITRNGFRSAWGEFIAEGIVAKPAIEMLSRTQKRIATKIKHKDFIKH